MSKKPVAKTAVLTKSPNPTNRQLQKEVVALQGEVTTLRNSRKHVPGKKHKHHPAKGKHAKHPVAKHGHAAGKKRGLPLGETAACCAAEAVAASARLAGHVVADADVLALHAAAGGTADGPVSIAAALAAAAAHGIGGIRPAGYGPAAWPRPGVILGTELPGGPHAVTLDDALPLVWSWGGLCRLSELGAGPVEEAWAVSWS